ncbi:MAG: hydantoinase B/oxoprolinase family protein, partial [Bacteroidota bacterium]
MNSALWKICIDTGGTFTDCLGISPNGDRTTLKLLSSGIIRAQLVIGGRGQFHITSPYQVPEALFNGYTLTFSGLGEYRFESPFTLHLSENGSWTYPESWGALAPGQYEVELSSGEAAPVVAARLITQTSLVHPLPPVDMRLGTTKGTNALLERKGAKVALLITEGFEDILKIGNQQRPDLFSLRIERRPPVTRHIFGVQARIDAKGVEIRPLGTAHIQELIDKVKSSGCDSVAIALMHSYLNPIHEQQLGEALDKAGISFISCSSTLSPLIKFLPRLHTTVINAYLQPVLQAYLNGVRNPLPDKRLLVMTSAASLEAHDQYHPKDSLLSGPAGGLVGAAHIARQAGFSRFLTLDMGGTSTDVARYDEQFSFQDEIRIDDFALQTKAVSIHTVAAGGGSICSFDGHTLRVGPESAGAHPGPACYGKGGPLSLTDIALLGGMLDPVQWTIPLSKVAAEQALQKMALEADLSPDDLIEGLLEIACETMANAIRVVTIEEGVDPREFALLAFGGAGGQYACRIADKLGITNIIVPREAGILSAIGMGVAPLVRQARQAVLQPWPHAQQDLGIRSESLKQKALQKFPPYIQQTGTFDARIELALRFQGQDHYLTIHHTDTTDTLSTFYQQYKNRYGYCPEDRPVEIVYVEVLLQHIESEKVHSNASLTESKQVQYDDTWEHIPTGTQKKGPFYLSNNLGSLVVDSGWTATFGENGDAILKRAETPLQASSNLVKDQTIALSLFTQRFKQVAMEMGSLLARTSFSVNVKERLDFSCALLDANGYLVANAPHIPVHLGSLGLCTRLVHETLDLQAGDVALTNHPGYGGSHLPDITLVAPVFFEGERIGFVSNRAHHAEIGGKRPGSMPPDATRLVEEGIVFEPVHLVKAGVPEWQVIEQRLQEGPFPSRAVAENLADLHAGLAAIRAGQTQLIQLCQQFGRVQVQQYMQNLQDYTASRVREAWQELPTQKWQATEYLDDGTPLSVSIQRIVSGNLQISFQGTGDTHPENLNANPAIVQSVVAYIMRLLLREDLPLNAGLLSSVQLE